MFRCPVFSPNTRRSLDSRGPLRQKTRVEATYKTALIAHIAPYIAWWICIFALNIPAVSDGWQYAIRAIICLGVFLAFRPWRWYPRLQLKNIPAGLGVGIFIFFVWVGPESATFRNFSPTLADIYSERLARTGLSVFVIATATLVVGVIAGEGGIVSAGGLLIMATGALHGLGLFQTLLPKASTRLLSVSEVTR